MDVFIIHSGNDEEIVQAKLSLIKKDIFSFNPLLLSTKKKQKRVTINRIEPKTIKKRKSLGIWKLKVKRKIKRAQMVLFFVGENSHTSENVDWELREARRAGKPIYTVKLNESYKINEVLLIKNKFSDSKMPYNRETDVKGIVDLLKNYEKGNYNVLNQESTLIDKNLLLEQYKIFLQTSEDLISRRQNVNNFYISINSALLTVYGVIWALNITNMYKAITGLVLSTVGIILSLSWIKLLQSYGNLNYSKMKIISRIEKELPASLYDAEWSALSDTLNKKKYVSFTQSEQRIPILFIAVYVIIALFGAVFILH